MSEAAKADGAGAPVLVYWYSGGYTKDEGTKTLEAVQKTLKKQGVKDQLVLHHSNEYGFTGEGYEPWPKYVDRLVEEIDKSYAGRPLILFGHSKGTGSAMSVAHRLGSRVLKCYVVACSAWLPGRPSPWEKLSKQFKMKGDQGLLAWFASLNPGNLLLETVAYAPEDQFDELVESSSFMKTKLVLMRQQYRDAIFPDMKQGAIEQFPAELCAVSPLWDGGSQPLDMVGFRKYSKRFELWEVKAGHADVLSSPEFLGKLSEDVKRLLDPASRSRPQAVEFDLSRWQVPLPRSSPAARPAPKMPPKTDTNRLDPSELREIYALLNAKSSKSAALLEMQDPANGAKGEPGAVRTVLVDLPPSGPRQLRGAAKRGRVAEDSVSAGGAQQAVQVDPVKGPLVNLPDGTTKQFMEDLSFAHVTDGAPQYGPGRLPWRSLQSSDRKVLLYMAAKFNKQMQGRMQAAKQMGDTIESQLPDFLQSFAPRGKGADTKFWDNFQFKETEKADAVTVGGG
mmetsp:Transcript_5324/g.15760  ORF Transcript_5324/g.15760 Transcript_5324/m.15760 type:complete len:508 (-) Transcript_5324:63-1586(-)